MEHSLDDIENVAEIGFHLIQMRKHLEELRKIKESVLKLCDNEADKKRQDKDYDFIMETLDRTLDDLDGSQGYFWRKIKGSLIK